MPVQPRTPGYRSNATFMHRRRHLLPDGNGDPMEAMGNLFDVATLIGVGFLIMALSSFGLQELVSAEDVTIVKNPGASDMEIVTKSEGRIERLQRTQDMDEGRGYAIGTVYRLDDGTVIWVPQDGTVPDGAMPDNGTLDDSAPWDSTPDSSDGTRP
jgi:hypothetical protein